MAQDLVGVFINGCDALLISEWKTDRKIMALAPAKEGKGDIIIVTNSGGKNALFVASFPAELNTTSWPGLGTCSVQFRIFRENVGSLKESAVWVQEKYHPRR